MEGSRMFALLNCSDEEERAGDTVKRRYEKGRNR